MIRIGEKNCPICGGNLLYYDTVRRIFKSKSGSSQWVRLRRLRCPLGHIHRELPDYMLPHKHYDAEIIFGVLERFITQDTLGFEDFPCALTMKNWLRDINTLYYERRV